MVRMHLAFRWAIEKYTTPKKRQFYGSGIVINKQ